LTTHVNLKEKNKILSLANLLLHKLETCNDAKNSLWHTWNFTLSTTQRTFFHTPQIFNESKNSLAHTFTLKFDTFKKLEEQVFHAWKTYNTLKKSLPHLPFT
jgi:hypothetical protein